MLRATLIGAIFILGTFSANAQDTSGNCSPIISGSKNITIKCGDEESEYLTIPIEEEKKVPLNILDFINVGSPMRRVDQILGTPFRSFNIETSIFEDKNFPADVSLFRFKDLDMKIVAGEDSKMRSVTIQRKHPHNTRVNIPPFQHTNVGKIELGIAKIGDLESECAQIRMKYVRTTKDAYFAAECYFGNVGDYRYYVFGCYCFGSDGNRIVNGKLLDFSENELPIRSQIIDFLSISSDLGLGTNIDYQLFR